MENLYNILKIDDDASHEEIVRAYKREALIWHPQKNPNNKANAITHFNQVTLAYEILSDPKKKEKYDATKKLERGVKHSDPISIFTSVFGPNYEVPDDTVIERITNRQDPPVVTEFQVSLEHIYSGIKKIFEVTKNTFGEDEKIIEKTKKRIEINVKRGWKSGTKIIFEKEGDIHVGRDPADLIFVLREAPHPYFVREGNNVIYNASVTLKQALKGVRVTIPLLDGQTKVVTIGKVIYPNYVHRLEGLGFPDSNTDDLGDLLIRFYVRFPHELNNEQRDNVSKIFDDKNYHFYWK
jgi:DnaJ-class molecular chaperone